MLLTPDKLHPYQQSAINHQCTNPNTMLWLDMGLGKTPITLTSIVHLLNTGFLRGVIVVAPIRVIKMVWRREAAKWEHTKHLRFSMVVGTKDQRTRALMQDADVYLINYENLGWLAESVQTYFIKQKKPVPFNGLVWDEISKMKNSTTQRVKAFLKIENHFDWTTGLTGTPASNGYKDLHGQYLVVDKGDRLGRYRTAFRQQFYYKQGPFKEVARDGAEETIKRLIGDITLEMSAEDYNPLPDMVVNDIEVDLSPDDRAKYEQLEKEMFFQLDRDTSVEVFNAAALTNKCLQFSNGAVYPIAGFPAWQPIHDLKLDALEEIIEEAQGNQVLCAYAYKSDAERIMKRFAHLNPINLTDCKSQSSLDNAMRRWGAGDCPLMIGHPACLHPRTQVLTESRGWVKIVDVRPDERVFDGVEFVSHDGCSYSGHKDVIDVFGVTMTPDHKILVRGEWRAASDLRDCADARAQALYEYQGDDPRVSEMLAVWGNNRNVEAERSQTQQEGKRVLRAVRRGPLPQNDQHSNLANLDGSEVPSQGHRGQELRGSGNHNGPRLVNLREVLSGYESGLRGQPNDRADRRGRTLLQGELHLDHDLRAASQQAEQQGVGVAGSYYAPGGTLSEFRCVEDEVVNAPESRNDGGRGSNGRDELSLWEGVESQGKAHVYDLVNCGPRHRFLIRNDDGEIFISHNSMGHGIDGLQDNGFILAWYGLTWSLDLYLQFNARVRRQGQGRPVMCHRIMTTKTLDQAQALALSEKDGTQNDLRKAVKQYRMEKGV